MRAIGWPSLAGGTVVVCLVALTSGCVSTTPLPEQASVIDRDDTAFAQALAHYSSGLLCEAEYGRTATQTVTQFELASELAPSNHFLVSKIAAASILQLNFEKALRVLEESCRRTPESASAWADLAATRQMAGMTDQAIDAYSRLLELAPSNTMAYIQLAVLYFQKQQDQKAIDVIRAGCRRAAYPGAVVAYCYNAGKEFIDAGQHQRAVRCFQVVAENMTSDRQLVYHLLGQLYENLGNTNEATRNFQLATEGPTPVADSFVKLAEIHLSQNPDKALAILEKGDTAVPDNTLILFTLAIAYMQREQYDKAMGAFEKLLAGATTAGHSLAESFYLAYADACEKAGRRDKAIEVLTVCLQLYPDSADGLNFIAYMWAEDGVNLDTALAYINRALEAQPDNPAFLDTLGWIYFKMGQHDKALEWIGKAMKAMPEDPVITDHFGDTLDALGDRETAIDAWKRSYLLDSSNPAVGSKLQAAGVDLDELKRDAAKTAPGGKD